MPDTLLVGLPGRDNFPLIGSAAMLEITGGAKVGEFLMTTLSLEKYSFWRVCSEGSFKTAFGVNATVSLCCSRCLLWRI